MRFLKHIFLLATICLGLAAAAETVVPRVSMITCHAGSNIYELCGHSALRIQVGGEDIAVNYGLFDFDAPNFVYRFVKGETDYMVGTRPFEYFLRPYIRDNRRVVEQELNLTPQQAWNVVELIRENLRHENRVYRYNYVKDNCATRPIAILEKAICDTISFSKPDAAGNETWSFRDEMRYFHKNYPWYQFGIDLCLGSGIDYTLNTREKGFAPEILEQLMDNATITDSTGIDVAFVLNTNIINAGNPNGAIEPPTPWYLTPFFISALLLILTISVTWHDIKSKKVTKWIDSIIFGIYGTTGCVLTFLIFVSVHEATSPNWLYLWLNPLCFIPAVAVWVKHSKKSLGIYHIANFVALFLLVTVLTCGVQSGNPAFYPLILSTAIRSLSYLYINLCATKTNA